MGLKEYRTCKHMCYICGKITDLDRGKIAKHVNKTHKGDGTSGQKYLDDYIKDSRENYKSPYGVTFMTPTELKKLVDNQTIRRAEDRKK